MDDLAPRTEQRRTRLRRLLDHLTLDLTPLRISRDFRVMFIGQFISSFGSAITFVVVPWQTWKLTHSTSMVGLMGVAEFVPMLATAFVAGALADSMDRRRLLLYAEAGLSCCLALLLANAMLAQPRVWVLFVAAGVGAIGNALHRPALEALMPRLVGTEHMPAVSSLTIFRHSFNLIIGPALAGLLADSAGAAVAYAIDLGTYAVAIVSLLMLSPVAVPKDAEPPSLGAVIAGLRYARTRHELMGTYLIDIIAMFFGMPLALFPALAESFHAKVGWFYSILAVGPLLVTATSGWTKRVRRHGLAVIVSVMVWGVAIIGFGLARQLWLALLMLAIAGAADCVSGLFRLTIWNQTIPDRVRGRLASIEMVSYTSGPYLGNAEAGLVAGAFGLRASIVSGGVLCLAGAALLALLLPAFAKYDSAQGIARKQAEDAA